MRPVRYIKDALLKAWQKQKHSAHGYRRRPTWQSESEMPKSLALLMLLAAFLTLSGCASRPPVPACPPPQILQPVIPTVQTYPEGWFLTEWAKVIETWTSGEPLN